MKTLPVSEYKNHPELWKFPVVIKADTATIYESGDDMPDVVESVSISVSDFITQFSDAELNALIDTAYTNKGDAVLRRFLLYLQTTIADIKLDESYIVAVIDYLDQLGIKKKPPKEKVK